jgi:SPP1 family predicted phage head-tail adaptor
MIGAMRDRIIFKSPVHTDLPGGGGVTEYVESFRDWTKIIPLSTNRSREANQERLQDGFSFEIRYRNSPQPNFSMLIEYEGKDYAIGGIEERNERKRFWIITAVTNNNAAIPLST